MPLAFSSLSHGTIAFGFFNIHTQMLLLDRLFFLADDFCEAAVAVTSSGEASLACHRIEGPSRIGNLHGAIAGRDLSGLIGATYAIWPFPEDPSLFRQHTDGARNDAKVAELIEGFGEPLSIALRADPGTGRVEIGPYHFSSDSWLRLLGYVIRGGYPRWRDDVRPDYVAKMERELGKAGVAVPVLEV